MKSLLTLIILAQVFGCGLPDSNYKNSEGAIVSGVGTSDYPAVGYISFKHADGETGHCTATLIGKHTVLTAAHCIVEDPYKGNFNKVPSPIAFYLDGFYNATGDYGKKYLSNAFEHPSTLSSNFISSDIAILKLAADVDTTNFPPMKISSLTPNPSDEIKMVGFGITRGETTNVDEDSPANDTADDDGTKQLTENIITGVNNFNLFIKGSNGENENTCFGDSGGPAIAVQNEEEVIVGVDSTLESLDSTHPNFKCGDGSRWILTEKHFNWIKEIAQNDLAGYNPEQPYTPPQNPPKNNETPTNNNPGQGTNPTQPEGNSEPSGTENPNAPTIKILFPENGSTVGLSFRVGFETGGNSQVAKIELVINGQKLPAMSNPCSAAQANVRLTSGGSYRIKALAYDSAGNSSSDEVSVTASCGN